MIKILLALISFALIIYLFPTAPFISFIGVLLIPTIAFLFIGATKP